MNIFENILDMLSFITSTLIAVIRLFFLAVCFIASGLQIILFTRTEICNVEMKAQPLRCDKTKMDDKISYVDKLMIENPDLLDLPDHPLTEEEMRAIEDFENEEGDEDDGEEGI